jgi:hypothetical protein
MLITGHLKGVQDMKKLQVELISMKTEKKDRQAQMELLQEREVEVIVQEEEAKKKMAQIQGECAEMINKEVTVQVVDTLREKTMQAQTQVKELTEKF